MRKNCAGHDNQNHGADSFADEVRRRTVDRAPGAEDAQLGSGVGSELPVRSEMQSHDRRAAHGSQQLCRPVVKDLRIIPADDGRRQRDGGIEVRAGTTESLRHQDAAQPASAA